MTNEQIVSEYKRLQQKYDNTPDYLVLMEIFNKIDPICVAEEVRDEYGPENVRILDELPKCKTKNDVKLLVFRVIAKMLGDDVAIRNDNYLKISEEIINNKEKFKFRVLF